MDVQKVQLFLARARGGVPFFAHSRLFKTSFYVMNAAEFACNVARLERVLSRHNTTTIGLSFDSVCAVQVLEENAVARAMYWVAVGLTWLTWCLTVAATTANNWLKLVPFSAGSSAWRVYMCCLGDSFCSLCECGATCLHCFCGMKVRGKWSC